jgi:replication-associated recombination protein RarA
MRMGTKNGFNYYVAVSALQKAIRRCDEEETCFWGIELYDSNYIPHLWNRLFIIAHEDIGLAENGEFTKKVVAYKELHDHLATSRPKKVSKKLVFLQMLIDFANAKKSRYTDLAYSVYWAKHDEIAKTKEVPDYVYDMHTSKGKKLKRGLKHFYEEAALINNANKMPKEEEFEKLAMKIDEESMNKPTPAPEPDPVEEPQPPPTMTVDNENRDEDGQKKFF